MLRCEAIMCKADEDEIICRDYEGRAKVHSEYLRIRLCGVLEITADSNVFYIRGDNLQLDIDDDGAIKIVGGEK